MGAELCLFLISTPQHTNMTTQHKDPLFDRDWKCLGKRLCRGLPTLAEDKAYWTSFERLRGYLEHDWNVRVKPCLEAQADRFWRNLCCRRIQRAWRRCISVPEYVVCKKRLCSEFETKYLECCISNFLIRNFLAVAGSLGTA